MPVKAPSPSLYGIKHSNRDFSDAYYWGKNQFNSAFPVALACYMRDKGINAVYLRLDEQRQVVHDELPMGEMFGSDSRNDELYFPSNRVLSHSEHWSMTN